MIARTVLVCSPAVERQAYCRVELCLRSGPPIAGQRRRTVARHGGHRSGRRSDAPHAVSIDREQVIVAVDGEFAEGQERSLQGAAAISTFQCLPGPRNSCDCPFGAVDLTDPQVARIGNV